jgi:hypothetical protein
MMGDVGGVCFVIKRFFNEKGEIWEGRSMTKSYINYNRWIYQHDFFIYQSVDNYVGISDTSLYCLSCLNPTVISSVTAFAKTYTSSYCLVF